MITPACGVVLVTVALCVGCARDPIRQQAEAVMSRTTPAGADRPFLSAPSRDGMTLEYTWRLRVATVWPTYAKWAADQLSQAFTCRESQYVVECVRTGAGDSFTVRLSLPDPSEPHEVAVIFTARPN